MQHQFYHIFSDGAYKGLTECPVVGENEILLKKENFDPQTQDFSFIDGEISINDNSDKKVQYEQALYREKIAVIDRDTQREVVKGFSFDGHTFSLSQNAQLNWQGLLLLHQVGLFEDQEISTKMDESYLLVKEKLLGFITAGKEKLTAALAAGRTKKQLLKTEE